MVVTTRVQDFQGFCGETYQQTIFHGNVCFRQSVIKFMRFVLRGKFY